MSIEFASPNAWPIYDNWILISKGASRIVALKNGKGLDCKPSTTAIGVTELTETTKNIRPGHRAIAKRLALQGHRLFLLTGKSPSSSLPPSMHWTEDVEERDWRSESLK